jgi:NTE family protein
MRIGVSLSGGGFRATVFHLGVLARLAEEGRLEDVAVLSTVSGGSLCVGLVYAHSDFGWPSSREYLDQVLPKARDLLTSQDLQLGMIGRVLRVPTRIFDTRADDLSLLLQERWGVTASLDALPPVPRWLINATCYETGENWCFERQSMGDPEFGYSHDTDIPLSDALAASAGFPGLIGPLEFNTRRRTWFQYAGGQDAHGPLHNTVPVQPAFSGLHLWDGGVYDNLGLESLRNSDGGWREGVDFLIASDGCSAQRSEKYRPWNAANRMVRGIMMDQIRSLRLRALLDRFKNHGDAGCFLQIGQTCDAVLRDAHREDEIPQLRQHCLSRGEAQRAADTPTDIRRLSPEHFELLLRHGFEVADYTLHAFHPDEYRYLGYHNARCANACLREARPEAAPALSVWRPSSAAVCASRSDT